MHKNSTITALNTFISHQQEKTQRSCDGLFLEYAQMGVSRSMLFNVFMRLFAQSTDDFDTQRYYSDKTYAHPWNQKMDIFYEKLHKQPWQWPLRLLQYTIDPCHPFVGDSCKQAQDRMQELAASE